MPAVESLSVGPVSNRSYSTTSAAGGGRYFGNEPTCGQFANHVQAPLTHEHAHGTMGHRFEAGSTRMPPGKFKTTGKLDCSEDRGGVVPGEACGELEHRFDRAFDERRYQGHGKAGLFLPGVERRRHRLVLDRK